MREKLQTADAPFGPHAAAHRLKSSQRIVRESQCERPESQVQRSVRRSETSRDEPDAAGVTPSKDQREREPYSSERSEK
ncbi:MAG: hypothetical protein PHO89_01230 [Methylacidiphilaceae bacterium]|nr:hypothetical protein [Candidatus Methylacidiphilaceae bacterium]